MVNKKSLQNLRIISLVPSITELLFDLGLENNLIGRTKFCIHPKIKVQDIPQFGGTKKLHLDKIKSVSPTLIIANKEENLKFEIEELQKDYQVLITEASTLDENNQMIIEIGKKTGTKEKAQEIVDGINAEFANLESLKCLGSVLYLIWNNPIMSIGKDTFIHSMIEKAGFFNSCGDMKRYPIIVPEMNLKPDYVFLSSEPFPFKEKHKQFLQKMFSTAKFEFVDGEMFSWYGSRMQKAPRYFLELRQQLVE